MSCIVCGENKKRKSFKIKQSLSEGFAWEKEVQIDKDICEDCFKLESISGQNGLVVTTHIALYAKDFARDFWEKSDIKRDDIYDMKEVAGLLKEKGLLKANVEVCKSSKKWIKHRDPTKLLCLTAPSGRALSCMMANFIKKSDLEFLITHYPSMTTIRFRGSCKHKISEPRIQELVNLGYVLFDKNNHPKFGDNLKERKRVCVKCGEIKSYEDFYQHASGTKIYVCLECESKRDAVYYKENRERLRAYEKEWRRSDKGKLYRNKPERRAARNIRSRLRDFLKTQLYNYNKDMGCTSGELKEYIASQFPIYGSWMSWENYGNGKNGDHKDAWHIDHIIPLSGWDELKHINPLYYEGMGPNHFSNLRPLDGIENITRGGLRRRTTQVIDFDKINEHFLKMAELYPDKGFGPINLQDELSLCYES